MKLYMSLLLIVTTLLLSSCGGAIKVSESTMKNHSMNMKPVGVLPTLSEWKTTGNLSSNQKVNISIIIKDKTNKPIQSFQTVNEKLMHLIVVSKDLSYFAHIHPVYKGNGEFDITTTFPKAGDYKLISETTPKGGIDSSVDTHWLHINGIVPQAIPLTPDKNDTKVVDGVKAKLSFDMLMSKMALNMTFTLYDAKTNKPITNLEHYLGVMGHCVAISKDVNNYLHIHPMKTEGNGPKVTFMTYFPKAGVYKIWGQFQYHGRVIVIPFVVKVP
ncbi:hypothetical protein HPT25_11805 [Bacillus sp. BRMEA1]|uniref:hypothetical protein n=1 Tax=Neobacillus endophyticus TaxID=2738405 RepID=UPI0015630EEF|nr:hypothetical protein [Neobacillus endophyticus]NRD78071.1 hypothetical protein [Neobacillus endophyticus]